MMRGMIVAAALVAAFLCVMSYVSAHEAPSGWSYDHECCHNQDCAPIPEDQTPKPLDGGNWRLSTGEIVPKSKVKFSPDGFYHLCRLPASGTILCLYTPPSSS
jgi:hypothetical protein